MVLVHTTQAELALKLDDVAEARRTVDQLLPAATKAYGDDNAFVAEVLSIHGDLLVHENRLDEARAAHDRAMAIRKKVRDDHPDIGRSLQGLATVALAGRRYAQAIEQFERALKLLRKGYGPESAFVVAAQTGLGAAYLGAGQTSAAVAVLQQAVSTIETRPVHLGEGEARRNWRAHCGPVTSARRRWPWPGKLDRRSSWLHDPRRREGRRWLRKHPSG